jgi:hypothetical protein
MDGSKVEGAVSVWLITAHHSINQYGSDWPGGISSGFEILETSVQIASANASQKPDIQPQKFASACNHSQAKSSGHETA